MFRKAQDKSAKLLYPRRSVGITALKRSPGQARFRTGSRKPDLQQSHLAMLILTCNKAISRGRGQNARAMLIRTSGIKIVLLEYLAYELCDLKRREVFELQSSE